MENEFEKGFMAGFLINQRKSDTPDEPATDGKWTYPSNWLPLSKVRDNEISALVFVQAGYLAKIYVYGNTAPDYTDWGDPDGDTSTPSYHEFYYDRGVKYNDRVSMFKIKIHYSESGSFKNLKCEACFITACAISDSVIDPTLNSSSSFLNNRYTYDDSLQYLKITGNLTNFENRNRFLCSLYSLQCLEFDKSPTKLPDYTFYNCYALKSVNIPDLSLVESVGNSCFYNCYSLDKLNLPKLNTAGTYFCSYNYSMSKINLPLLQNVGDNSFNHLYSLKTVNLESLEILHNNAFHSAFSLETIELPALINTGDYFCRSCYKLNNMNLPLLEVAGNYFFADCSSLKSVKLPSLQSVGDYAFYFGRNIEYADLPELMTTWSSAAPFLNCSIIHEVNAPNTTISNILIK